ncbi:MAG: 3-isopropylmalate dehydratase [Alphaproteobacteria bacterium]|jgi:3-isopropylmalate/(R)-2-methylmalate dehydratase small subunit|nr:3-isopropylmalate dehydratase [Alphaproteobacteria bacterium]
MNAQPGKVWKFGDDIDTDVLAPGLYMKRPIAELARHCLELVDPRFAAEVQPGDIVVGGRNFGMGSSREQAAEALKILGVAAVLAQGFAGIFYRNALNLGLLALVCPDADKLKAGTRISVDPIAGTVTDHDSGTTLACEPLPQYLLAMVRDGGLMPHLQKKFAARSGGEARP